MHLLLLEDDLEAADYVLRGFREVGAVIDHARDGGEALMMITGGSYDVLILDRMVPAPDGLKLLNMIRAGGDGTPAIFLSALGEVEDRVEGLGLADDYLIKPFAFSELHARVAALLRRRSEDPQTAATLSAADLEIDLLGRRVLRGGQLLDIQPTEFRLLEFLVRRKGDVVTRTMLLEQVWGFHFEPRTNIVETHISRLRAKIDRGFERPLIQTVRGAGYRIDADD